MIVDSWLEQSIESNRIAASLKELGTSHALKETPLQSNRWMDDLNEADDGPEDENQDDFSWMDDLDEAA